VRHLDLFSGIGGFALAARWVGWETVGFCEIEPYCQKVLRKHWPDVPIYDDVRELTGETVGSVDIITGGYPCQPFSVAGKRRGEADDRHLWPEFARLIRELRPRWVVGENVAGHIGMGLDEVLSNLEGLGYTWETFVIPACAVNAPHRRDRVWTVAYPNGNGEPNVPNHAEAPRILDVANPDDRVHEGRLAPGEDPEAPSGGQGGDSGEGQTPHGEWVWSESGTGSKIIADTSGEGLERHGEVTGRARQAYAPASDTCWWKVEPPVGRMVDGLPDRSHRIKGLGNSIVPQIAEAIFRSIVECDPRGQATK